MRSVFSRLSEASATSLMCSGRLFEATLLARLRIEVEPEFGGDHHLLTERREGFADEFFVRERAVHFGGVKECDAALDGRSDQRDTLLLFDCRAVAKAQTHAAEPDGRDFQVAVS